MESITEPAKNLLMNYSAAELRGSSFLPNKKADIHRYYRPLVLYKHAEQSTAN